MAQHKPRPHCVICHCRIDPGESTCLDVECRRRFTLNQTEPDERPDNGSEKGGCLSLFNHGTGGGRRIIRSPRGLA